MTFSFDFLRNATAVGLTLACFGLAGCETAEGVGEDVENAGEAIQRGAN